MPVIGTLKYPKINPKIDKILTKIITGGSL